VFQRVVYFRSRRHHDLQQAGIDQAAMSGKLTGGLSLNVAIVSRLK
jgi:hypothetical protein